MTKKASLEVMISRLSKDELLALVKEKALAMLITERDIVWAKIKILEKRANYYFEEWQASKLPESGSEIDAHIAFFQALKRREAVYAKYERAQGTIDRLFDQLNRPKTDAN